MYDERLSYLDQQRAEQREAERRMSNDYNQGGVVGLALLPVAAVVGVLCGTLRLVLEKRREQEQDRFEAKRLEERILEASQKAHTGKIIPLDELLRSDERRKDNVR